MQRFTYYKEFAHIIMEADESKNRFVDQQAGDIGKLMVYMKSKGSQKSSRESPLLREAGVFFYSSDFQLIRWGQATLWKTNFLLSVHQFEC